MWYIEINGTNGYLLFGRIDYYGLGIMAALTPDVWQHITATCDGETGSWYIDGELMTSNNLTLGSKEDATLSIGAAETGGVNGFFGAIDEVRLYDTALTQEEIQTVMYDIGVDIELALKPRPRDEATEVKRDVILSWIPGLYAHNHNVYFGTDFNDVNEATPDDPRGVLLSENQDGTTFDPFGNDLLEYGGTYYWRIDEINDLEPNSPWIGETWSFTTGNFIVVDDFEDYNDFPPDEIWNTWIDGYDVPTNGSSTGYPNPDFIAGEHYMEDTVVRSGLWSMPVFYDNSTARLSEVTRTFDSSMGNWTVDDVVTLTLFYYGDSNNTTEPMYVAVDSALVTNDDANAALITEWTRWDIPLQELVDQGVNLNSVGSMTIGFGNKANPTAGGGAGHVFFDDIRLYRP